LINRPLHINIRREIPQVGITRKRQHGEWGKGDDTGEATTSPADRDHVAESVAWASCGDDGVRVRLGSTDANLGLTGFDDQKPPR
jgi:hypothetical protein